MSGTRGNAGSAPVNENSSGVDSLLEVKNLCVSFDTPEGRARAVDDTSFAIRPGETLGLVGESGCGKTVTALALMRLIQSPPGRIESGQILFKGTDLLQIPERDMRRIRGNEISMVFQEPMTSLNPVFTCGYQVEEAVVLHQKLSKREAYERTLEMLSLVKIPDPARVAKSYPHQLSGGMRQRVMIAMAIACQPILLIADEPTTALDVTIQAQILDLMRDLVAEKQTALILITHDLGVVAGMCERTSVMYAGFIVEQAGTHEVFARPRHPYTLGLLSSIPRVDDVEGQRLTPIQGIPPDLTGDMDHCPFAARCRNVQERCWSQNPALEPTGDPDEHAVACWYPIGEGGWREIGSSATSTVSTEQAASRTGRAPVQVS